MIVPFPPGGPTDIVARLLAQKLTDSFKQTVVVDNRPGGGATIGTEIGVRAAPDGYTLMIVAAAYAANAALYKLPYDPIHDITPIALIGETGFLVTLHPSVPVASTRELIAHAKANPGKLNYGSGGTGSATHLATALFNQMAQTQMTHVPYKGVGVAVNDVLGGQIHLLISGMLQMIPHMRSGRLRGIAVTTLKRSAAIPEVPTVAETVPGYDAVSLTAAIGPKALPRDIAARWNSEINRVLQLSDIRERFRVDGVDVAGGTPERLREVFRRDIERLSKVVKAAGIKAEN